MTTGYEEAVQNSERLLDAAWVDSRGEAIVAISVADLRALLAGPPEHEGLVLVPREPTEEMLSFGERAWRENHYGTGVRQAFTAMLSVAPKP